MGKSRRVTALAGSAVLAAAALVYAVPHAPSLAQPTARGVAVTAPCVPNRAAAHGALPAPPQIDTWNLPPSSGPAQHAFTLDVLQYRQTPRPGESPRPDLYCYTDPQLPAQFVEAPTIRVKQGGTFTMTLADRIPGPHASAPASAPDGCAMLPYEAPIPAPGTEGYLGHTRVTPPPAPSAAPHAMNADMSGMPNMLPNDTNFHTHGWHVDPNVDNVFKSLAHTKGGRCAYAFAVRANQPPGTYWYHAHLHGIAQAQVGGGLAGALVVLPSDAQAPRDHANRYPDVVVLVKNDNLPAPAPGSAANARLGAARAAFPAGKRGQYADLLRAEHVSPGRPAPTASPGAPADPWNPPPWPAGVPVPTPPASPCPPLGTIVRDPLQANGLPMPALPPAVPADPAIPTFAQATGTPTRYRIVDASSDTFINLALFDRMNHQLDMTVVGRDGVPVNWDLDSGAFSKDPSVLWWVVRKNVFLAPSNRVDVLVDLRGATPPLRFVSLAGTTANHSPSGVPYCTGPAGLPMPARGILTIVAAPRALRATANAAPAVPHARGTGRTGADAFAADPVTGRRVLTFTQYDDYEHFYVTQTGLRGSSASPPPGYDFHEQPFWLAPYTGAPPTTPPIANHYLPTIRVPKNSVEEWTLINATPEIHAFHIHQLTFTALSSPFEPNDQRLFLDSLALPAGTVAAGPQPTPVPGGGWFPTIQPSKTVIKIDFRHVDRGTFVYHCHMLFHEDHGMMGIVEVY
ncbi:MAG TPA: multicopper oxidase domain-containing protein [Candidatus Elarobacter sp.]|jgi:FtsP/CotA-like multicopper oxidase with cupredoxin domain|nr:multicopper oxidase domain-containing protein [Candidatus Elarobacter sp.]